MITQRSLSRRITVFKTFGKFPKIKLNAREIETVSQITILKSILVALTRHRIVFTWLHFTDVNRSTYEQLRWVFL